jgi:hypothetical protein
MSRLVKQLMKQRLAGVLAGLAVLATPAVLYADASAPWAAKHVAKKHKTVKHVTRKRKSAVRSVRHRAPKPMAQPEPQVAQAEPAYTPPPEPAYTPPPAPEPAYTPPPAPEPTAPVPVAAAAPSGGGFPFLAVLGGLAAIGGIVAVASSNSSSP